VTAARRGISPGIVFLAVALVGSVLFTLYAITVRDADQIPLLAAGSAVLGIVFIAVAAYALRSIWRAGIAGRNGQALALGIGGGIAVIIGAGCVAVAIILFLLAQSATA
jgi:alanine dehydrogenase